MRESPAQRHYPTQDGTGRALDQRAHNPKVAGSNPAPATKKRAGQGRCESTGPLRSRPDF
jgi:hypothetical protein